ncbi:hypothetical protein [Pseudophaeobacter leonis]|uniref:hypothetical protein n=1 Tax=Pseudophaeobacter leonis TaxID=1144477 RepID=UPI0009F34A73|nr:hypothetical protein [Pseudophaeobacter leonis]
MHNRRSATKDVTPKSEDTGLFKKDLGQFAVALVPHMKRSSRGDLVIRGYLNGTSEIYVIFAGRRAKEAAPIENLLNAKFKRAVEEALKARRAPPEVSQIRLPLNVEGAWRSRFSTGCLWLGSPKLSVFGVTLGLFGCRWHDQSGWSASLYLKHPTKGGVSV